MSDLTQRQAEIVAWLKAYVARNGYGPSAREIGKQFGITSPNGVMGHLRALEKKGAIVRDVGPGGRAIHRAFRFPEEP